MKRLISLICGVLFLPVALFGEERRRLPPPRWWRCPPQSPCGDFRLRLDFATVTE